MAKERLFNLPETKGTFQLKGIVTGAAKDNFYKETKTQNGKDKRTVNFGLEVEKGKTLYTSLQGFVRDEVYFYKRGENGAKGDTAKVRWADRHTFKKDGYNLLGLRIGVTQKVDENGTVTNENKTMVEFDACSAIGQYIKDGDKVFVKGNVEFSSFPDKSNGTIKRRVNYTPNQVSLCTKPFDLEAEDFNPQHDFTQTIVFTGVEPEMEDEKRTGRYVLSAKIITYSTIEDATFIILDRALAKLFDKNLKPYTAIKVWGIIDATTITDEVETKDMWGATNKMDRVTTPTRREMIIVGADPSTIDTEVYNKNAIEEAMVKIKNAKDAENDYADNTSDGWGKNLAASDEEDEEEPW